MLFDLPATRPSLSLKRQSLDRNASPARDTDTDKWTLGRRGTRMRCGTLRGGRLSKGALASWRQSFERTMALTLKPQVSFSRVFRVGVLVWGIPFGMGLGVFLDSIDLI